MDREVINNLKCLALDMIETAKSGHPGIALSAAPIIYTLFSKHLNINLTDTSWINRDRFVLSAGHGSALLYATLFMAGYDITIDDLKKFRQRGSITPGHPEYLKTPGVEVTTGPLGEGIASAVGMALASKMLSKRFELPKKSKLSKDRSLINNNVYVLCSDGDLMEGITNEALSLAGTLKLDNLIILYDSNNITLDGRTDNVFTEDTLAKYRAMGFATFEVKDGVSVGDISNAIEKAKGELRPSIIEIHTILGNGSELANTNKVHGHPLGNMDVEKIKLNAGISLEPFHVNASAVNHFRNEISNRVGRIYEEWAVNYQEFINGDSNNRDLLEFFKKGEKEFRFNKDVEINLEEKKSPIELNNYIMSKIARILPNFIGGSADLSSSTRTDLTDLETICYPLYKGKNIKFGVRENAMGAILNGLAISGYKCFGSTFLTFADYMKPSIRMTALMNLPVTYIFTHDSINIGQDGPTHQPIEQLAMLRTIPNLTVYRPCDGKEILGCWYKILNQNKPACLVLSKQELEQFQTTNLQGTIYGGYIVRKEQNLNAIIIATGSEVSTAIYIANAIYNKYKFDIRVVSMPCVSEFLKNDISYRNQILPKGYRTIVIEAGSNAVWGNFVYSDEYLLTLDKFGISGDKNDVLDYMDFSYEKLLAKVEDLLVK